MNTLPKTGLPDPPKTGKTRKTLAGERVTGQTRLFRSFHPQTPRLASPCIAPRILISIDYFDTFLTPPDLLWTLRLWYSLSLVAAVPTEGVVATRPPFARVFPPSGKDLHL